MQVREFMTPDPICCTPDAPLFEAARIMATNHIGVLPVVKAQTTRELVGILTDRDIATRAVAEERSAGSTPVAACMSTQVATVSPESTLELACRIMQENRVHRLPVVNGRGECEGIVAECDIARVAPPEMLSQTVREVTRPFARNHVQHR